MKTRINYESHHPSFIREHSHCENCMYWLSRDDNKGECRTQYPSMDGTWPTTKSVDWCCGWFPKTEEDA